MSRRPLLSILFLAFALLLSCTACSVPETIDRDVNIPIPAKVRPEYSTIINFYGNKLCVYEKESLLKYIKTSSLGKHLPHVKWDGTDSWVIRRVLTLAKAVDYVSDFPVEFYKTPGRTLMEKSGDCEDLTILTAAYLRWCGYPLRIKIMHGKRRIGTHENHLWLWLPDQEYLIDCKSSEPTLYVMSNATHESMHDHGYAIAYEINVPITVYK